MRFLCLFFLLLAVCFSAVDSQLNSCGIAGRVGCIASCAVQNCATGSCQGKSARKTCVCARCAKGPVNIPIKG